MPTITYAGHSLSMQEGESVLETLLLAQCEIPNSCRAGVCQACLMQLVNGQMDIAAQKGLKDSWQAQGLFLACQCHPADDLEVLLPSMKSLRVTCQVVAHTRMSAEVIAIRLLPEEPFAYHPGQHVTLWRDEQLGRTYSLASVPLLDGDELEFHIKRLPEGGLSPWLHDSLQVGDRLQILGPGGDCFYTGSDPKQPLLLAGTGTGLAPLYGILRDALQQGHTGEIHLYHGAVNLQGLYLHDVLQRLAEQYANLHYHACTLNSEPNQESKIQKDRLDDLLKREYVDFRSWRVYLCGDADFVNKQRKTCYLAGARLQHIYADAFIAS